MTIATCSGKLSAFVAGLLVLHALPGIASTPDIPPDINDRALLEAFVDGVVESGMDEHNVVGVVVAITRNDEVILAKGYGYSDLEKKTDVDPERTLFRIGSVTKLFTWTALMQLHEQGRIELDRDVNDYLRTLQIPDTYDTPITVAELMTHSGGFEDRIIGLFSTDPKSMLPYADLLGGDLPDRVRPPGWVSSYSNHGVGVAGLIVEDVSGLSWADYVQTHILDPLGMSFATAQQPLPENLAPHMSNGYRFEAGKFEVKPFEFVPLGSAGGMSVSALDMTRFARAHLNQGLLGGHAILQPETARRMASPLFKPYPQLNGWLHGFAEYTSNNRFMLGHNGGTFWFFTEFVLIPEENMSVFISTNSAGGAQVNRALFTGLRDRYFPVELEAPSPVQSTERTDLTSLAGSYATYRHPVSTPGKLLRLASTVTLVPTAEGQLMAVGLGKDPIYWQEVEPLVFRHLDSSRVMTFVVDDDGTRMFVASAGGSFYKLGGIHTPAFQYTVEALALGVLLWALIAWPIQRLRRGASIAPNLHRIRLVGWFLSLSVFTALLGIAANASDEIVYGLNGSIRLFLLVPYATLALLAGQVVLLVGLVRDEVIPMSVRAFHVCVALSAAAICALMAYWNLIGT